MPGTVQLPGAGLAYGTDGTPGALAQKGPNGELTGQHLLAVGQVPTAVAGSNAGGTPPAPVVAAGAVDARGSVTGGTGTTPAAGNLIAVTFNQAFATAPSVVLTPLNAASAALFPYVTAITAAGFTIATQGAPSASQANTTYAFNWIAVG